MSVKSLIKIFINAMGVFSNLLNLARGFADSLDKVPRVPKIGAIILSVAVVNLSIFSLSIFAAESYTADFLSIGVGADAMGVGGAVTANTASASSTYWNPAGLAEISRGSISLLRSPRLDALEEYNCFASAVNLGKFGSIGINWIRLAIDDIPVYEALEGTHEERLANPGSQPSMTEAEKFFNDVEQLFSISYARRIARHEDQRKQLKFRSMPIDFAFGVTVKYLHQSLWNYRAKGWGIDLGVKFRADSPIGVVKVGGMVQDAFSTKVTWNTSEKHRDLLIGNLKAGVAFTPKGKFLSSFTVAIDLSTRDGFNYHGGLEYRLAEMIALRTGVNPDATFGVGIFLKGLQVDYALTSAELASSHVLSLGMEW